MDISPVQLPNQRLTEAEKIRIYGSIEKWGEATIKSLIGIGSQIQYLAYDDAYRKQVNYNLVSGHINEDDFQSVTKPFGLTKYNFPATLANYNIITPKISLLEGEESRRPFNFRVVSTGADDINAMSRQKTQMMQSLFRGIWLEELQGMGVDIENEKEIAQNTPEEVELYFQRDYKSLKEINEQNSLEFLIKYCELQDKFNTGWRDLLVTGEEVYWTGIRSGEPVVEVINPVYFHYDRNPNLKYIEDAAWAFTEYFMPPADVYDRYYDVLTEEQVQKIEEIKGGRSGNVIHDTAIGVPIRYSNLDDGTGTHAMSYNSTIFVHVIHCEWKSLSKIGFVRWIDENGQEQETQVDEHYKVNPYNGETVEWRWINTVWEATRIGDDIFVNVRPKPNQYRNLDNPSKCRLGYVGVLYNARNSRPYSMVEIMKPHQYLYNIVMYRLELELARAQGKKMIFDIAQIPRSEGFDVEKWLYYFNVLGVAFINSFEEGKGKFAGQRPQFNQFQAIDMSLARVIDQYVMLLSKIEDMVGDISGVTRQREGQIANSETVGGVERSVRQSSYITESLFTTHNMCKQHVLSSLLDSAKLAWSDGKKVNYVMDDMTRILLEIDGTTFCNAESAVFVSDNGQDDQILETIKQLAQHAMASNQASFKDVIKILKSKNITKAETILEESYNRMLQQAQAQRDHEAQLQTQTIQAQAQEKQAEMQNQNEMNQRDNDTKIQVALINAESQAAAQMSEDSANYGEIAIKAKESNDKLELKRIESRAKLEQQRQQAKQDQHLSEKQFKLDKDLAKEQLKIDKDLSEKEFEAARKLQEQKARDEKSITREQFKVDKSLQTKQAENDMRLQKEKLKAEAELAEKKRQDELKMHEKEMQQQEKEHQREQEIKIQTEKIKADAQVKAAKAKPKPKPSSGGSK